MDKIDELQQKCFAMLGTIAKLKEGEIDLETPEGVSVFSSDAKELFMITSSFFNQSAPR